MSFSGIKSEGGPGDIRSDGGVVGGMGAGSDEGGGVRIRENLYTTWKLGAGLVGLVGAGVVAAEAEMDSPP